MILRTVYPKSHERNVLTLLLFSTRYAKSPEYLWSVQAALPDPAYVLHSLLPGSWYHGRSG